MFDDTAWLNDEELLPSYFQQVCWLQEVALYKASHGKYSDIYNEPNNFTSMILTYYQHYLSAGSALELALCISLYIFFRGNAII
jgi:hypothetical protein